MNPTDDTTEGGETGPEDTTEGATTDTTEGGEAEEGTSESAA